MLHVTLKDSCLILGLVFGLSPVVLHADTPTTPPPLSNKIAAPAPAAPSATSAAPTATTPQATTNLNGATAPTTTTTGTTTVVVPPAVTTTPQVEVINPTPVPIVDPGLVVAPVVEDGGGSWSETTTVDTNRGYYDRDGNRLMEHNANHPHPDQYPDERKSSSSSSSSSASGEHKSSEHRQEHKSEHKEEHKSEHHSSGGHRR